MLRFLNKKIYLDNAASTPLLKDLSKNKILFNNKYYDKYSLYYNPSAIYSNGLNIKNILNDCKLKVASILNVRANEIIWNASGTESINLALRGLVYYRYYNNLENKNLDHSNKINILTTNIEHSAVLQTLLDLQKCGMINLYILEVETNGILSPNVLKSKLQELIDNNIKPDLVSIMYVNNEIGTIQNIKEYGKIIDKYNRDIYNNYFDNNEFDNQKHKIIFYVDACQAANYLDLDIRKLKVDMMTLNSSKIYAGKGCGLLYKNKNIKISPIITGGSQEGGLRSGTENIQSIINFTIALEQINKLSEREKESLRLRKIQKYVLETLYHEIEDIKFWPQIKSKNDIDEYLKTKIPNNINISFANIDSDQIVLRLDKEGFELSHKSACDSTSNNGSYVLKAIGADDMESKQNIRITMGRETTLKDMIRFVKVLKNIYTKYRIL